MLTKKELAERPSFIGGSDAPAIAGVDDYRQKLDVYYSKTGEIAPIENLEDTSEAVLWGNVLEDPVRKQWAKKHGETVLQPAQRFIHPRHQFIQGSVDGILEGKKEGIEIKTRGAFVEDYGKSGTDQVKESDIIQCHHYMACTGYKVWKMAVLIGGQEMRSYVIHRDESLIRSLIDLECAFWDSVQKREPPDMDFHHRSTPDLLQHLFPGTNGETEMLGDRAVEVAREMEAQAKIRREADKAYKALKNERDLLLGPAAIGILPDGSGGWSRKQIVRAAHEVSESAFMGTYFSKKHQINTCVTGNSMRQ